MAVLSRLQLVASQLTRRGLGLPARRGYGSAAAAQLQYDDDYYYEDEEEDRRTANRNRMLDSDGWVPGRGIQWVLIGDRGAKKHLYTERLSKLLEVPHISMGTLVRQELNPRSSLYKQVPFFFSCSSCFYYFLLIVFCFYSYFSFLAKPFIIITIMNYCLLI